MPDLPKPDLTLDEAVERAYETRPDYQAALERVRAAEAARQAIIGEALPSVSVNADYGDDRAVAERRASHVHVIGACERADLPGRAHAAAGCSRPTPTSGSGETEADDLKAGIYYEVRTAFLDLQATDEQLQVATQGARTRGAAADAVARSLRGRRRRATSKWCRRRRRWRSRTNSTSRALYGYDLAKGALIRGIGMAEETLRQILGGSR